MSSKITLVDYGVGNLGSVLNMLKKVGADYCLAQTVEEIEAAQKLILPGVGAFDKAMTTLKERNFIDILNHKVLTEKTPILGICLGMQMLTNKSSEGTEKGFGWIDGEAIHFNTFETKEKIRIPHMGWNLIAPQGNHPLTASLDCKSRFYFCHSYYVKCKNREDVIATTVYGNRFDAIIGKENVIGAQFHPEKSHKFGMQLFNNFKMIGRP